MMRTSIARRLVQLALVPAALLGVLVVAAPAQAAAPTTVRLQSDIVAWTNAVRKSAGCAPVRLDAKLALAARSHSAWMARYGKFSHTGSGGSTFVVRVKRAGYVAPLSENIAWGYRDGRQVVTAWMKSPGHRANLLNCRAKAVGVGAVYAANGTTYFTQEFGSR
ncbi:CAP domain-containing protein [Jidongwangia harbinensis]|uniref:CAP domain-containing protein n=1 Tax=Jidongwangia harbinensis TaxID=2878561 RepID=UPI0027E1BA6B|nr:CAP domain-containing protein [Jidongwangia harbinensis]